MLYGSGAVSTSYFHVFRAWPNDCKALLRDLLGVCLGCVVVCGLRVAPCLSKDAPLEHANLGSPRSPDNLRFRSSHLRCTTLSTTNTPRCHQCPEVMHHCERPSFCHYPAVLCTIKHHLGLVPEPQQLVHPWFDALCFAPPLNTTQVMHHLSMPTWAHHIHVQS